MSKHYPADHHLIRLLLAHFDQHLNREVTVIHQSGGTWAVFLGYTYNPAEEGFWLDFQQLGEDDDPDIFTIDAFDPDYDIVWET